MTEDPVQHEMPMCVRIWLEVGHACEPRNSPSGRALALDWRVWVRGISGTDISGFVHKVVFHLHPSSAFVYPKRVLQEPPYEIQESGCVSILIPIHVYLKYSTKPKKIRLEYKLNIENNSKSSSESTCVYYDFVNPPAELLRSLMQGGGENVGRDQLVTLLPETAQHTHKPAKPEKKYEFVEPIKNEQVSKKRTKHYIHQEVCPKCGKTTEVNFKRLLAPASMSSDEIRHVSRLYASYKSYEKSVDALQLPPFSDPIYQLPELPPSLQDSLKGSKDDYALL